MTQSGDHESVLPPEDVLLRRIMDETFDNRADTERDEFEKKSLQRLRDSTNRS